MPQQTKLEKNLGQILLEIGTFKDKIFTPQELGRIFEIFLDEGLIGHRTRIDAFIDLLRKEKKLKHITINGPSNLDRYITGNINSTEVALSIAPLSYISHATALEVHGLGRPNLKKIFVSQEQSEKSHSKIQLHQENIDSAFSKPQRISNAIYEWNGHKIYLLKGKYSNNLGVVPKKFHESRIFVTDIEKTILDITVRPEYANGVDEVATAYKKARGHFSVKQLYEYLTKMKFIYPYHQAIGFYLSCTGYSDKEIDLFRRMPRPVNFYLNYALDAKILNQNWRIYVPENFSVAL